MTQQSIAAANAARYTREDMQRRLGKVVIAPKPEGNSLRHDKYLILMFEMSKRAVFNRVTKRDMRLIAQGNAGDKLRAGRMMLAFLEKTIKG